MNKGISPLIASVLLIAFTLAIAGIYSGWINSLIKSTTTEVQQSSETRVTCSYGGIALSNLKYNTTASNGNITGTIENTDIIALGNIDIEIFFTNATRYVSELNRTLQSGEKDTFKIFINTTTYDKIRVRTNCSNVFDELTSSYVTQVT